MLCYQLQSLCFLQKRMASCMLQSPCTWTLSMPASTSKCLQLTSSSSNTGFPQTALKVECLKFCTKYPSLSRMCLCDLYFGHCEYLACIQYYCCLQNDSVRIQSSQNSLDMKSKFRFACFTPLSLRTCIP